MSAPLARPPKRLIWLFLFAFLFLSLGLALLSGSESVRFARAWHAPESLDAVLLWRVRLPRALLALVVGAGLGVSGAALQALLRNPLAEPYVLGVSGGAALGASLALLLGAASQRFAAISLVTLAAWLGGALVTLALSPLLRRYEGRGSTVLLAGVVINACAAALITLLRSVVSAVRAQELLFWLTGFLSVPSASALSACAIAVAAGALLLWIDARALELLGLGEASAAALGVAVPQLALRTLLACSLITAAAVSNAGMVGFVGLLVPHAARGLGLVRGRAVLLGSALLGGCVLLCCDAVSRQLFRAVGSEIPVGALTALLGGPLFLWLLLRPRAS